MKTLSVWSPFVDFDSLVRNSFGIVERQYSPAAEITRDGEDAVVRVDLPGLDFTKDVSVEVDRNRLVIKGERRDERTEDNGGRTLREVRYGAFSRTFVLPTHVTADAVTASYEAGVLSVRVAGAYAGTQAKRITVTPGNPTADAAPGDPSAN